MAIDLVRIDLLTARPRNKSSGRGIEGITREYIHNSEMISIKRHTQAGGFEYPVNNL